MILIVGKNIYDLQMARSISVYPDEIWIEWASEDILNQEKIEIPEKWELSEKDAKNMLQIIARYKNNNVWYSLDQLIKIAKQDNIDFGADTR